MARSVRDLRLALSVLEGPDAQDPYAVALPVPDDEALLRVGWTTDAFGTTDPEVATAVLAAAESLSQLGLEVEQTDLPWLGERDCTQLSSTLFTAEMLPYLREVTTGREAELHPVLISVLASREVTLRDYVAAEQEVEQLRTQFARWFARYDVLLCPVTSFPAPLHAQTRQNVGDDSLPARAVMRATVPFNLTGLPAVSIPFGSTTSGLPVGVQLVSRWWTDRRLLDLAQRLEQLNPSLGRRPPF